MCVYMRVRISQNVVRSMRCGERVDSTRGVKRLDDSAGVGCNTGPDVGALLCNGTSDGRSLHFTLGVDDNTSVILKYNMRSRIQSKSGGHTSK